MDKSAQIRPSGPDGTYAPTPEIYRVWVANTPPSFNAVGYTGSRWKLTRAVKEWHDLIASLLLIDGVRRDFNLVLASATITFCSRRRRDVENYRVILSKALGDALVSYGVIEDDTHDYFRLTDVKLEVLPGVTRTEIVLECS